MLGIFIRIALILSYILMTSSIEAQGKPHSRFIEAVLAARQPLVLTSSELTGSGATTLREAVASARYILLGEDHFSREIPEFAAALCDSVKPDAYAVEVGPNAARVVSALLKMPTDRRIQRIKEYLGTYPESIAFLNSRSENDLAARCVNSSGSSPIPLWGLDQEFLGSAGSLLVAMVATKPGPQTLQAIALAQTEERTDEANARLTGDYLQLFIVASTEQQIDALRKAVAIDGNPQTGELLDELTVSRSIYRLHATDPGASFAQRAELMKQHFLSDYRPLATSKPTARVLFKFGDNHMGKGLNATHNLDLGNFIAEYASAQSVASLHILAVGLKGTHSIVREYGKPMDRQPFDVTQDADYRWLGDISNQLEPQSAQAGQQTLTLLDLRKLRYRKLDMSAQWEKVVYSFDLLVVEPQLTVADEIR